MSTILAIDDKQDNLITISALLDSLIPGCTILTALSGPEGIETAAGRRPDVIILDIKMPGMDGFKVCSLLKSREETRHIPVILLTAIKTDIESKVRGLEIGADAFLTKPIDEMELIAQINVMLRIKKAEDLLRKEKDLLGELVAERTAELEKSRNELIKERDFIKSLDDSSPAYYAAVNPDGTVMTMNRSMLAVSGYQLRDVKGGEFTGHVAGHDRKRMQETVDRLKKGLNADPVTVSMGAGDGRHFMVEWHGKPFFTVDGALDFVFFVGIDVTERKRLEKVIMEDNERERNRIGQDLHDGLGQHLAGISFKSEILKLKLKDRGIRESEDVQEIINLVSQAMNQARDLAKGLCPVDMEGGGLRGALEDLKGTVEEENGVSCLLNWDENVRIERDIESTHLYYIAREAVNNAVRHGKSKNIMISVARGENAVVLKVADDGRGMPGEDERGPGTGIGIMQYRAWMIGAAFSIESRPGTGTTICCTLHEGDPMPEKGARLRDGAGRTDMKGKAGVFIVDDHPIVRQGLIEIINREEDLFVCGEARNADEAMTLIARNSPDLLIVDISLQGTSGIDLIHAVKNRYGSLPVLVLSIHDESLYAERSIRVGARGYVMKQEAP